MKKPAAFRAFLLVLAVALLTGSVSRAQALHIPPHEKIVLKNGLTLLLMQKQGVPMVNFYAVVKTGSAADPPSQAGLASMRWVAGRRKRRSPSKFPLRQRSKARVFYWWTSPTRRRLISPSATWGPS